MAELQQECEALEHQNRELRVELSLALAEVGVARAEAEHWRIEAENLAKVEDASVPEYQENFLITSFDHILFEKQKQIYLISGIQNSLAPELEKSGCPSSSPGGSGEYESKERKKKAKPLSNSSGTVSDRSPNSSKMPNPKPNDPKKIAISRAK